MSTATKIEIILTGSGGELAREIVTIKNKRDGDLDEAVNLAVHEVIEDWRLSAGDSITINTVLA